MAKNHWHSAGSKTRSEAYKYGYKSGLELSVSKQIETTEYDLKYETETIHYIVPERKAKYTPDFVFIKKTGELMFIETKGRWTAIDRLKMKHVIHSNPGVDIRMVFQNPNQKISKISSTTYETHANKLGIIHVAKNNIPAEWLLECVKTGEEPVAVKNFFN